MVREQPMVGISGKINHFSSLLGFCDNSFKEGTVWLREFSFFSVLQCPWITPTNTDDVVQCYDGSFCNKDTKGWNCCETRQGIMKCPKNHPKRCASTDCLGNSYHCCRSDCKKYGGDKECRK